MSNDANTPKIHWDGGECPVRPDALVKVALRNGWHSREPVAAAGLVWTHTLGGGDIVAFWVISSPDPDDIARYQPRDPQTEAPKPRTKRVRIAVSMSASGHWSSAGWSDGNGANIDDASLRDTASEGNDWLHDGMRSREHIVFVEADIPLPDEDEPVVEGEVTRG